MLKTLVSAAIIAVTVTGAASAATLNGIFSVDIYHRTGANTAQSAANEANLAGSTFLQTITYKGDLDFKTNNGNLSTIGDWLATGFNGVVTGLNALTAGTQLSASNINNGSAVTTFFDFTATFLSGFDSIIRHDDGITVFDDGTQLATSANPTTVIDTIVNGFDGGTFRLIYAATNNDPSILKVTGDNLPAPVPLPAGMPLILAGLGGLAMLRKRARR